MSACISRDGEYSDHELTDPADPLTCQRCWAFDEAGLPGLLANAKRKAWDEGYAYGYWQDRGYSHDEARTRGVPEHLRVELGLESGEVVDGEVWNPYADEATR